MTADAAARSVRHPAHTAILPLAPDVQARLEAVTALTDAVCADTLGDEYAGLARAAAEALAAGPGPPLLRGKAEGWAAGIVRAVGYVNFLSDPGTEPHLHTAEIAGLFGVSEATAATRARDVRDGLGLVRMDPHWTLPSALVRNPMAWLLTINGMPLDARHAPAEIQARLADEGHIPFAPAVPSAQPPRPRWPEPDAADAADLPELDPDAPRLRLRVSLDGVEPEVWRMVTVPAGLPLDGLHQVLQAVMGWKDCHLHTFEAGRRTFGPADAEWDVEDERRVTVEQLLKTSRSRLVYTYDMGDGWEHTVRRDAMLANDPDAPPFACVGGAGACPPEDCGGPWGYMDLLAVLADPSHPDHAEMLGWTGGPLDPAAFDLDATNRALRNA